MRRFVRSRWAVTRIWRNSARLRLPSSVVAVVFATDRSGDTPAKILSAPTVPSWWTAHRIQRGDRPRWSSARRLLVPPAAQDVRGAWITVSVRPIASLREAARAMTPTTASPDIRVSRRPSTRAHRHTKRHRRHTRAPRSSAREEQACRQRLLLTGRAPLRPRAPEESVGRRARLRDQLARASRALPHRFATPLHNNVSERRLRVVALSRKNFLFVGHPRAARSIAALYSLVASCIANGVEPTECLTDILARVRDAKTDDELDALLPDRWSWAGTDVADHRSARRSRTGQVRRLPRDVSNFVSHASAWPKRRETTEVHAERSLARCGSCTPGQCHRSCASS